MSVQRWVGLWRTSSPGLPTGRSLAKRNATSNAPPVEVTPEGEAVIASVADQALRPSSGAASSPGNPDGLERPLGQPDLAFLSALDQQTDRKSFSLSDKHQFCAFALAGQAVLAGQVLPAAAGAKDVHDCLHHRAVVGTRMSGRGGGGANAA